MWGVGGGILPRVCDGQWSSQRNWNSIPEGYRPSRSRAWKVGSMMVVRTYIPWNHAQRGWNTTLHLDEEEDEAEEEEEEEGEEEEEAQVVEDPPQRTT